MAKKSKGIKLPRHTGTAAEEADLLAQEQQAMAVAEMDELAEEIRASDDAQEAVVLDQQEYEELLENTEKMESDLEAKSDANKVLDERKADAIRLAEILKETDLANAAAIQSASNQTEPQVRLRAEREQMNMNPNMYKEVTLNPEFIASVRANTDDRKLNADQRKVFNEQARGLVAGMDEKTINLRHGNFAMERVEGSSQVVTKEAVQLLHSGDKASNTVFIAQMHERSNRLIRAHESRIEDLQDRVDHYRERGEDKKADFYELKIAHEEAAFNRDTALNVLAQREYIDADRGETEALKEQRAEVERLRERADLLFSQVEKMEEYERAKEETRELDTDDEKAFEAETEELNSDMEDEFADIEQMRADEDHQQQLELEEQALQEAEEEDPLLAEHRALDAHERDTEAFNAAKGEEVVYESEEDTDDRALRDLEESQADVDSDSDDAVAELDEDQRTDEDLEHETERDAQNPTYDMKSGKVVLEQEEQEEVEKVEPEAEIIAEGDDADAYSDVPYEVTEEPEFEDEFSDADIEDIEVDSPIVLEEPAEVVDAEDFEHREAEAQVEVANEAEADEPVSEAEAEWEAPMKETQAETEKEIEADLNQDAEIEIEKAPIQATAEQQTSSDVSTYSQANGSSESDADKAISEKYLKQMDELENEIETAKANGDHKKVSDAQNRQVATCKEFNSYMDDRSSFDNKMATLRSSASEFASSKDPAEREQAKQTYVDTMNSAANDIHKSGDKPWSKTMATQLKGEYKDQIDTIKKGNASDAKQLDQAVKDSRNPDTSKTVRVTREDVETMRQVREAQKQTQTDKSREGQSQSASA